MTAWHGHGAARQSCDRRGGRDHARLLAEHRQRIAHGPYGSTAHWDNLQPDEQRLLIEEADAWLRAAHARGGDVTEHDTTAGTVDDTATMPGRNDGIRWGLTLTDLDRLAKTAAATAPGGHLDGLIRYQTAWSAIAETLLTVQRPPDRATLIRAGRKAIAAELAACMHARGYLDGRTDNGPASSPRYTIYWHQAGDEPAADRIIDHLAAAQIGDLFTAAEGKVVEALAAHDDHALAAAALGMGYGTFSARLSEARRRFTRHWYAPDTPPPTRRHDKRRGNQPPRTHCPAGHEMSGDNVRLQRRTGGRVERVCRACDRERGVARWQAQKAGTP